MSRSTLLLLTCLVAVPHLGFAQGTVNLTATDASTGTRDDVGATDAATITSGRIGVVNLSFLFGWDGTTWSRVEVSSGKIRALVDCNNCGATTGINSAVVEGPTAHDAVMASTVQPLPVGGYASAAAPTDVTASGDLVRAWHLLNGAQVFALQSGGTLISGDASGLETQGGVAHDAVNAGNPHLQGFEAIAHGTNPTAVAAGDRTKAYANRQGIPFTGIPHPNIITREWTVLAADGAQTGTALVDISAGTKIVVLYHKLSCDADNSVDVDFRMAFDTDTTFATASATGTNGIIDSQPGVIAGGGSTMDEPTTGGDGEDVRYSLEAPTGGSCRGVLKYFTIES